MLRLVRGLAEVAAVRRRVRVVARRVYILLIFVFVEVRIVVCSYAVVVVGSRRGTGREIGTDV